MTKFGLKSKNITQKLTSILIILFITSIFLGACSSSKTVSIYCKERQIEIFVDDQYLGRDLVEYTFSKDRKYVEVSCRENGIEVYHKRLNVKELNNNNTLIELQIPKNYKYNSNPF